MSHLFYGVAYYDEYMPEDRLAKDIALMRETGINVVRIAESTGVRWSLKRASIISTISTGCWRRCMRPALRSSSGRPPTRSRPAGGETSRYSGHHRRGQQKYGPRQIMDIVNPTFRRYAEKLSAR